MQWLRRIVYLFTPYVGSAERRVGRFFARLDERKAKGAIERNLLQLIQDDLAAINLWTERRYKGYRYLTKRARRELYRNLDAITIDFKEFAAQQPSGQADTTLRRVRQLGGDYNKLQEAGERLEYMVAIMRYLSPRANRYQYRSTSSFGRLLKNPHSDVMVGDCNQIVTLYIALYALRYDVRDLQLVIFPGHVAIRFFGADVETTSGMFTAYHEEDQVIAPIQEVVSVNLLDTADSEYARGHVPATAFLESARLAYMISSNQALVEKNLLTAYHNVVTEFVRQHKYVLALDYAKQSRQIDLIEMVAQNGCRYAITQEKFADARRLAKASRRKTELLQAVDRSEAAALFNSQKYQQAYKMYKKLGDREMVRRSLRGMYQHEYQKLGKITTVSDIKAKAHVIRTLEKYANEMGDSGLQRELKKITKYL